MTAKQNTGEVIAVAEKGAGALDKLISGNGSGRSSEWLSRGKLTLCDDDPRHQILPGKFWVS